MSRYARQFAAAAAQFDNASPPELIHDDAEDRAIEDLMKIPAFVSEATSDCFDALALAFAQGQDMAPILEAACRAKAEQEIEDADELLDRRDPEYVPGYQRVVESWEAYQRKHGPHPAAKLCADYDAQVAA
ncbi:hypothetical protein MASR1M8_16130 [Thermomonas brevis]